MVRIRHEAKITSKTFSAMPWLIFTTGGSGHALIAVLICHTGSDRLGTDSGKMEWSYWINRCGTGLEEDVKYPKEGKRGSVSRVAP